MEKYQYSGYLADILKIENQLLFVDKTEYRVKSNFQQRESTAR